jgi:hypothetical protein
LGSTGSNPITISNNNKKNTIIHGEDKNATVNTEIKYDISLKDENGDYLNLLSFK